MMNRFEMNIINPFRLTFNICFFIFFFKLKEASSQIELLVARTDELGTVVEGVR